MKIYLLALLCIAVLASNCFKTASKTAKMEERSKPKITYAANIKDLFGRKLLTLSLCRSRRQEKALLPLLMQSYNGCP